MSLAIGVALLTLPWLVGADRAQSSIRYEPATACFQAGLYPATLIGDFYLDGNLAASGVRCGDLYLDLTGPVG